MSISQLSKPSHLEPSSLGTKEYWDALYSTELSNHSLDATDVGTIWFDDSSAEDKMVSFIREKVVQDKILGAGVGMANCSFLDLGTGNGHFLARLRGGGTDDEDIDEEEGDDRKAGQAWTGRMLGVDYSQRSIEFARRIAQGKGYGTSSSDKPAIEFKQWDIMNDLPDNLVLWESNADGWDVVLDKGTFDAISLSGEKDENGRRICEGYRDKVVPLVRRGGLLLVTSCNWTEEELKEWFLGGELEVLDVIGYRSFRFGGRVGQSISSVCFRRCAKE